MKLLMICLIVAIIPIIPFSQHFSWGGRAIISLLGRLWESFREKIIRQKLWVVVDFDSLLAGAEGRRAVMPLNGHFIIILVCLLSSQGRYYGVCINIKRAWPARRSWGSFNASKVICCASLRYWCWGRITFACSASSNFRDFSCVIRALVGWCWRFFSCRSCFRWRNRRCPSRLSTFWIWKERFMNYRWSTKISLRLGYQLLYSFLSLLQWSDN